MSDSKDQNEDLKTPKEQSIIPILIDTEMQNSYLDYAMSVIVSRALPDVRDGLKPVHRRILYAMHESGYEWNKQHRKSARVVGDVIGKYHPHGDQAVYDALVRLAQDFSMSATLIDGQGNFGSMDGDKAAAMRYTEVRMAKISSFLLEDIEKNLKKLSSKEFVLKAQIHAGGRGKAGGVKLVKNLEELKLEAKKMLGKILYIFN